jgi:hypothetical protein
MTRLLTVLAVTVVVCVAGLASPAAAQLSPAFPRPVTQLAAAQAGELQGTVVDDRGHPLSGAVVSALGSTSAFAVTDSAGRYSIRSLPAGPYLLRAHLQGYVPARGRIVQVNGVGRNVSSITLARRGAAETPAILTAGVGAPDTVSGTATEPAGTPSTETHDHGEVAWRLRHAKRGVLREATPGPLVAEDEDSFIEDSVQAIGRAMGNSARFASAMLSEFGHVTAEFNLLTSTSFERPEDLFSADGLSPRGVAFFALHAPTTAGDWSMRGAMTESDLASWIVAGSYVRRAPVSHQYEAGLSYGMQRYQGGNAVALAAVSDGSRNAGAVYAYDHWTVVPGITLNYGARYARYDYLEDGDFFSPSASVTLSPAPPLRVRASASRRHLAPGAEEFMPRAAMGVWLPPERTFSPISTRRGFTSARTNHLEVAAEHDVPGGVVVGVRAFHQDVRDQVVTLFGVSLSDHVASDLGHYYVGSAGDVTARGWGLSVSRMIGERLRGSIDYTQSHTEWQRVSPDGAILSRVARSAIRRDDEAIHDLTTSVQTDVPATATRVFVLYKINSAFASPDAAASSGGFGTRFDVQVNQALPFLDFTRAQWEMLLAVRSLFREELLDASVYDELLVVRPPKRIVGGLTVRF